MTRTEVIEKLRTFTVEERFAILEEANSDEENGGAFLGEAMMDEVEREVDDALAGKVEIIKVDDIDAVIDRELGLA